MVPLVRFDSSVQFQSFRAARTA